MQRPAAPAMADTVKGTVHLVLINGDRHATMGKMLDAALSPGYLFDRGEWTCTLHG